jgi:hypothetical protein
MVAVKLDFLPPLDDDIVALKIYESSTPDGVFNEIERATEVGTYPVYITEYTTDQAVSKSDWFAIAWENSVGALGDLSHPIQGGTTTVVGEIVSRALLRDPTLNENVLAQEAEGVVYAYYGKDAYSPEIKPTPNEYSGLTLLTMARAIIFTSAASMSDSGSGATASWVAGLVSMKYDTGSTSSRTKLTVEDLLALAARLLGIPRARIGHLVQPEIVRGMAVDFSLDQSRLLGLVELP